MVRAKELIGKRFALFCSIIVFILKSTAERSSVDYYLAAKAKVERSSSKYEKANDKSVRSDDSWLLKITKECIAQAND